MTLLGTLLKLTERRWQQQLVSTSKTNPGLLTLFGWRAWHDAATNAPRACPHCKHPLNLPRNDPGFPDLLLVRGGTLWFVELKSDRGVVSEEQESWLAALMAVKKIRVGVWRPWDIEKIMKVMR